VIDRRGWRSLRAVRNGRVHCIPDEFLNTPAPSLLDGLACIAAAAHPQLHPPQARLITLA
jgi:iron complex transport system substrate-binding protein